MDVVTITMDLLLATLLVAALAYGFKLERKLKALRDSQAGFAEAVRSLDTAASRAEAGLETLRLTTDAAHDELHDRILKARELKAELDKLIDRAERVQAAAPPPAPEIERPAPSDYGRQRLAESRLNEDRPAPFPTPAQRPERPRSLPAAMTKGRDAPAKRPADRGLDEDLFETAAPRARPASGVDR
jgi:ABC-type transporter Mla subunit MlaD